MAYSSYTTGRWEYESQKATMEIIYLSLPNTVFKFQASGRVRNCEKEQHKL